MPFDYIKARKDWANGDAKRDAGLVPLETLDRYCDLAYGDVERWNLLDIYRPKENNDYLPVVISIHGGGWFYGDKELYSHYTMRLAERGFAVINFNYRLAPEYKYPSPVEDFFKVCDFMVNHKDEYKLDVNNVFIVGDSAGAQLAYQTSIIISNKEYANLFCFKVNEGFELRACALNCGVYTFAINKLFGPIGPMQIYLNKDYKNYYEQLMLKKYVTKDFPPSYVMGACNDPMSIFVKPLSRLLKKRGVEHIAKIYGKKSEKEIAHVFHVNCKLSLAKICNDDECNFFKKHLK